MNTDGIRHAADEQGTCILNAEMCGELADRIEALTAGVKKAIEILGCVPGAEIYRTARELRELLERQSSGNPGQLEPPPKSG